MSSEQEQSDVPQERLCIRCDEPITGEYRFDDDADWTVLLWGQEEQCYPIHESCYNEVKGRDHWH